MPKLLIGAVITDLVNLEAFCELCRMQPGVKDDTPIVFDIEPTHDFTGFLFLRDNEQLVITLNNPIK